MRAKDFIREFSPEGFEQYTVYVGDPYQQSLYERFSNLDAAIEDIQEIMSADPEQALSYWYIYDINNNLVWEHDPGAVYDAMRSGSKVQYKKPDELNEFAPGNGGDSGRWYTDDQIAEIVGDGWWQDLDLSGAELGIPDSAIPKEYFIREAQAWLNDQGYSVHVLNCKVNDDDMEWFIEGNFHNPRFSKKDLNESTFRDHEAQLRDFVKWCVDKLNIKHALPKIRFQDTKEGPDQHRTGYYDNNDNIMWIYTGNRNLIDIMRTVAHELAHRKQHEADMVKGDQSYPGSPIEQQADAAAGYLMKLYGREHPEIIE